MNTAESNLAQVSSEDEDSDETNTEAVVRTMKRLGATLDAAAASALEGEAPPPAEKRARNDDCSEHFCELKNGWKFQTLLEKNQKMVRKAKIRLHDPATWLHEIVDLGTFSRPRTIFCIPIQGDHSRCSQPPVDTKTKVAF